AVEGGADEPVLANVVAVTATVVVVEAVDVDAHGVGTLADMLTFTIGSATSANAGVACAVASASGTSLPPGPGWNAIPPRSATAPVQPTCSASNASIPRASTAPWAVRSASST